MTTLEQIINLAQIKAMSTHATYLSKEITVEELQATCEKDAAKYAKMIEELEDVLRKETQTL